jgi:hypothetical protein
MFGQEWFRWQFPQIIPLAIPKTGISLSGTLEFAIGFPRLRRIMGSDQLLSRTTVGAKGCALLVI